MHEHGLVGQQRNQPEDLIQTLLEIVLPGEKLVAEVLQAAIAFVG